MSKIASELLVERLIDCGIDTVFGLPGDGINGIMEGFRRPLAAVQSFGNLAASGIAGVIWTAFSPTAAFVYIAAWMLVSLATVSTWLRPIAPGEASPRST